MLVITPITYLSILLTFSSVVSLLVVLSVAWQSKLQVGHYLHIAKGLNSIKLVEVIEEEYRGAANDKIRCCMFMGVCYYCAFFALIPSTSWAMLWSTAGAMDAPTAAVWGAPAAQARRVGRRPVDARREDGDGGGRGMSSA